MVARAGGIRVVPPRAVGLQDGDAPVAVPVGVPVAVAGDVIPGVAVPVLPRRAAGVRGVAGPGRRRGSTTPGGRRHAAGGGDDGGVGGAVVDDDGVS